jgi:hypothetical protein
MRASEGVPIELAGAAQVSADVTAALALQAQARARDRDPQAG